MIRNHKDHTAREIDLLIEALQMAASRHESYSRFNPRNAASHDRKAAAMHELRAALVKIRSVKSRILV